MEATGQDIPREPKMSNIMLFLLIFGNKEMKSWQTILKGGTKIQSGEQGHLSLESKHK